jgi:Na+/proline symporter
MQSGLTTLDYLVVAIYLIGTVGLGLAIGWKFQTGRDFFLAGRTLPWWAIGMSLVASDIGGTDIIGVGGAAYAGYDCSGLSICADILANGNLYHPGIHGAQIQCRSPFRSRIMLAGIYGL